MYFVRGTKLHRTSYEVRGTSYYVHYVRGTSYIVPRTRYQMIPHTPGSLLADLMIMPAAVPQCGTLLSLSLSSVHASHTQQTYYVPLSTESLLLLHEKGRGRE